MIVNQAALAGIGKSFSTLFNQGMGVAPSQWQLLAMRAPSEGRSVDYKWLGDLPGMREWLGDRIIKDISGFHYEIVNKPWESTIEVDRDDIQDDLIGVYSPRLQEMGRVAIEHRDLLVFALLKAGFTTLCFDGQYFFDDDHPVGESTQSNIGGGSSTAWYLMDLSRFMKPMILQIRKEPEFVAMDKPDDENAFMRKKFRYGVDDRKNVGFGLWQLAYGSKRALDSTYYPAAKAAMAALTKEDLETPLGIKPTHCFYPASLEASAKAIFEAQFTATGASNVWYKDVVPVLVPWLT